MVLNDVSFGLGKGQCLALLGPSGCGKSTLLSILAGLLPSDAGRIELDGRVIEGGGVAMPPQRRRFAMVFQDLSLWPHLTVAENIGFGLDYLRDKSGRAARHHRIETVLNRVGMHAMRNRYPAMLSGGQQQRVAIARAIVVEPEVLLMDEPLAALDVQLREELRDEIALLIRRLEITTIYVTHDHAEAMTVAHQVAVMNKGRIEQQAPPEKIFREPATRFVATFLGVANAFVDQNGRHALLRKEDTHISPALGMSLPLAEGKVCRRAVCIKNSFAGSVNEAHARTADGTVFRGFTPHPLPLDSELRVEFDPRKLVHVEQ